LAGVKRLAIVKSARRDQIKVSDFCIVNSIQNPKIDQPEKKKRGRKLGFKLIKKKPADSTNNNSGED
jgi:hypothetical protein